MINSKLKNGRGLPVFHGNVTEGSRVVQLDQPLKATDQDVQGGASKWLTSHLEPMLSANIKICCSFFFLHTLNFYWYHIRYYWGIDFVAQWHFSFVTCFWKKPLLKLYKKKMFPTPVLDFSQDHNNMWTMIWLQVNTKFRPFCLLSVNVI